MRILATSDLHVDYAESRKWIDDLSTSDYQEDILIVAGDVSDRPELLASTFKSLVRRFAKVLFVPGNHDLWVRRCGHASSFSKFEYLKQLARDSGVSMSPYETDDLVIVPLMGWYDYSFGRPTEELTWIWMDFHCCKWLGYTVQEVTAFFTAMNESWQARDDQFVISFSHFLPRIDTMPRGVPARHRIIYPVMGSHRLEEQLRALGSRIHVYGHSHVNRRVEKDGTLYVNGAFGNPSESHISRKSLHCVYEL